jgi:hypothetical protein
LLRLHADQAVNLSAIFEHQQHGYALNAESRGDLRVLIDVELTYPDAAGKLGGQLLDHGRDYSARPAPRGPHIKQHRKRRLRYFSSEVRISDDDRMVSQSERAFTTTADGLSLIAQLLKRHTVGCAARRAWN